jgi:hypothetical protein
VTVSIQILALTLAATLLGCAGMMLALVAR